MKDNLIIATTFQFSLDLIEYVDVLEREKKYILAKQILRSGTSTGAYSREAQNPESRADFIHKFKIAAKESEELEYWLLLCQQSKSYPSPSSKSLTDLTIIMRILSKIIATSKNIKTKI